MGLIDGKQLKSNDLTGASLNRGIGIYDETEDVLTGQIRFWDGQLYETINDVIGVSREDLSQAPNVSSDWSLVDSLNKYFYAYDSVGDIIVNDNWTDITLDTESKNSGHFKLLNPDIHITTTDTYEITYYITTYLSSGTSRSDSQVKLQRDRGLGYIDIPGSICGMYNRTVGKDNTNASATILIDLNEGDFIKIVAIKDGTSTVCTYPNSVGILIRILSGGTKGEKGIPGDAIQWLGELSSHPISPVNKDAYYNITDNITYIYNDPSWDKMLDNTPSGNTIQPYLLDNINLQLFWNTTANLIITGDNFDENCTVYLGDEVIINSVTANSTTQLTVNYTTTSVLQLPTMIIVSRNNIDHFGDSITCEVVNAVIGTGSAGTFITDFQSGSNSSAWGVDWELAIYGTIDSLDGYFNTSTSSTPSNGTGPNNSNVFTSNSQYMFTECSGNNFGSGQYGTAKTSNFRELTQVDFEYHMYGDSFGDFSLWSQNSDNTWVQRWLVNGEQQSSQSNNAITISLNASTWNCKTIEFRFASPTNNTGWAADIALDDIELTSV